MEEFSKSNDFENQMNQIPNPFSRFQRLVYAVQNEKLLKI
jgi:hypothetical protein